MSWVRKKMLLLVAVLVLVLSTMPSIAFANHFPFANNFFPPPANDWCYTMLYPVPLTRRHAGLDIRGTVPEICNSFDAAPLINEHIRDDLVTSLIAESRRIRARAITFWYDYFPTDEIISIVIYADVATTLPHTLVRSVNFCIFTGQILSMDEAVNMEITPLAERILAEKIRSNPERYYAALSALIADAFFLTDDMLVILFDGFRLSTRVGTVDTIELNLANIHEVILQPYEYRLVGPYEMKMIPLVAMLHGRLGYGVRWDEWGNRIIICRNGTDLIELSPRDNEYVVHGTQRRSLEAAPEIFFNEVSERFLAYVPITFFDQILPLTTYTIGWDGSITFLAYFDE